VTSTRRPVSRVGALRVKETSDRGDHSGPWETSAGRGQNFAPLNAFLVPRGTARRKPAVPAGGLRGGGPPKGELPLLGGWGRETLSGGPFRAGGPFWPFRVRTGWPDGFIRSRCEREREDFETGGTGAVGPAQIGTKFGLIGSRQAGRGDSIPRSGLRRGGDPADGAGRGPAHLFARAGQGARGGGGGPRRKGAGFHRDAAETEFGGPRGPDQQGGAPNGWWRPRGKIFFKGGTCFGGN